jgi:hypothetical protein
MADDTRFMNEPNTQLLDPWASHIICVSPNHIKLHISIAVPLFRIIHINIQVFWNDTSLPETVQQ